MLNDTEVAIAAAASKPEGWLSKEEEVARERAIAFEKQIFAGFDEDGSSDDVASMTSSSSSSSSSPPKRPLLIERNLIYNYKVDAAGAERFRPKTVIENNVDRIKDMHPEWNVVFDDDVSCVEKLMKTGYFDEVGRRRIQQWYDAAPGRLKSDLCRLAQLYVSGGVYMDNDLQLMTNLDDVLRPTDTFVSVWAAKAISARTKEVTNRGIVFQAFMAAAKGSPIVTRGLELFRNHIQGIKFVRHHDLGTALMGQALEDVGYSWTLDCGDEDSAENSEKGSVVPVVVRKAAGRGLRGVRMLREVHLEGKLKTRHEGGVCNVAVKEDEGKDTPILAFSRVVQIDNSRAPCDKDYKQKMTAGSWMSRYT